MIGYIDHLLRQKTETLEKKAFENYDRPLFFVSSINLFTEIPISKSKNKINAFLPFLIASIIKTRHKTIDTQFMRIAYVLFPVSFLPKMK